MPMSAMSQQAASRRKRSNTRSAKSRASEGRRELPRREILGLVVAMLAVLFSLSLISHRADIARPNWIGDAGRFIAELAYMLVGVGSWALAGLALLGAFNMLRRVEQPQRFTAWIGGILLLVAGTGFLDLILPSATLCAEPLGGMLGDAVSGAATDIVGKIGGGILLLTSFAIGVILATGVSVVDLSARIMQRAAVLNPAPALGSAREGLSARLASWREARAEAREERRAAKEARRAERELEKEAKKAESDDDDDMRLYEDDLVDEPDVDELSVPFDDDVLPLEEPAAKHGHAERSFAFRSNELSETELHDSEYDDESWVPESEAGDDESAAEKGDHQPEIVRPQLKRSPSLSVPGEGARVAAGAVAPESAAGAVAAVATPAAAAHPAGEHARGVLERLRKERADGPPRREESAPPAVLERNAERFAASTEARYSREDSADWRIENPMETPTRDVSSYIGGAAPIADGGLAHEPEESSQADEREEPRGALAQRLEQRPAVRSAETELRAAADEREKDAYAAPSDTTGEESDEDESPTRPVVRPIEKEGRQDVGTVEPTAAEAPSPEAVSDGPMIVESDAQRFRRSADDLERESLNAIRAERVRGSWEYPPLSFLRFEESETRLDEHALRATASALEDALATHKVNGRVTGICPGPIVTRFEFEPEPGTKLNKIANLSKELAMALKAETVRIIAPIPGKGCVGIELPNDERETVYLKEILADKTFTGARSKLTMALGKDVEGFPVVANLAKMPHLLVAGTTGSGKSVSVNAMITSLLYNASPDDVRLILIDPKQLEFAIYEDVPHLLLPVVTDVNKAATALQWAVQEMERRYGLMKDLKVRNVEGYNDKLESLHQQLERDHAQGRGAESRAAKKLGELDDDDRPRHRHMPYIVVVVDEFADLIMNVGKDVEVAVARLAQKARAAGIHVILATQRPSTDVVTGLIKSNFPTRISFRLISGTDSRVILDGMGAENLLGMGDMLFRPPGSSELVRVHGAFVEEEEIENVVDFLKDQREAEYDESILSAAISGEGGEDEEVDELFEEAVECCVEAGEASISMIQRRLRIGYNRAARIIDEMERQGIIGPASGGSSRREVLMRR